MWKQQEFGLITIFDMKLTKIHIKKSIYYHKMNLFSILNYYYIAFLIEIYNITNDMDFN